MGRPVLPATSIRVEKTEQNNVVARRRPAQDMRIIGGKPDGRTGENGHD